MLLYRLFQQVNSYQTYERTYLSVQLVQIPSFGDKQISMMYKTPEKDSFPRVFVP